MSLFKNMLERVHSLQNKLSVHKRWKPIFYIVVIVFCLFGLWLTTTNQGWIARNSFFKTFDTNRHRVITVYSADGSPIRCFDGTYNVEFFADDYLVIMNQNTGERINLYGTSAVVVDESPDFDHSAKQE